MATIAIIGALEKEIMQIKEELSNVCMVHEAGLNVVTCLLYTSQRSQAFWR